VMGDSSPAADKLMRSQGVRALPSFHFVRRCPRRCPCRCCDSQCPAILSTYCPRAAYHAHAPVFFRAGAPLCALRPNDRLPSPDAMHSGRRESRSTASAGRRRRRSRMRSRRTCSLINVAVHSGRPRRLGDLGAALIACCPIRPRDRASRESASPRPGPVCVLASTSCSRRTAQFGRVASRQARSSRAAAHCALAHDCTPCELQRDSL
jgi:hypothetical protein